MPFQPPENIQYAALVIGGSFIIEGTASFFLSSLLLDYDCRGMLWSHFFAHLSPPNHYFLGASLVVAIQAVKKGAAAEGMKVRDYVWRGHDPTSVAVMTEVTMTYLFLSFGKGPLVLVRPRV